MATDLTGLAGFIYVNVKTSATKAGDLGAAVDALDHKESLDVEFEAGVLDQVWHDQRDIAALGTDNLDLQALVNAFGHTCVLTSVRAVFVKNTVSAAEVAKYFRATTGSAQATWVADDVVRNLTGAGDDWTGTIHTVISSTVFVIKLVTGTYADVDVADTIENTTRSQNDTFTKATEAAPTLRLGVAGSDPVNLWLGLTELELVKQSEISLHIGSWVVGAGARVLAIENLNPIPAQFEIIVLGAEAA